MPSAFSFNHALEVCPAPLVSDYVCLIHVADAHQHFLHLLVLLSRLGLAQRSFNPLE